MTGAVETVRGMCRRLDPVVIPLREVPAVFDDLVALQKLVEGAVVRMTARYEEAGAWKRSGSKSAEDDIARKTGSSTGQARRNLDTSKRLCNQSKTDDAVRNGDLSPDQAAEVSAGTDASPDDEEELLRTARKERLHTLRRKAAESRAKADKDREATRRRLHKNRSVRRWNDAEGMGNLLLRLPADAMAEVDAALKPGIDRAYADARDAGSFETWENYAADVVKDLLTRSGGGSGGGTGGGSRTTAGNQAVRPDKKVIALIDVEALNRGHVDGEETCTIAGVGPVSVSAVRALLSEAFLSIVFTKGVDILNVTHLGRQVTAHQRTAVEARGCVCEMDGCGSTFRLDIDHVTGWCLTYDTRVEDLAHLCSHCHSLKTRHKLHLSGPLGARRFVNTDGTRWRGPPNSRSTDSGPAHQGDLFTTAR